jgi:mRNA-degrading endonuclease RelE of RelBE toxin-antitoxin system
MKLEPTTKFKEKFKNLPVSIQAKFYKQAAFLSRDLRYPSLRAKKYNEELGIWQARVDRNIRFYFLIKDNLYILLDIKKHPK